MNENERFYFVTIGLGTPPKPVVASSALEAVFKAVVEFGVRVEVGTVLGDGRIQTEQVNL